MGLLSGIKNTYKKSEAAVIVQNLLEHQRDIGFFDLDPGPVANRLVSKVWDAKPDIFGGKFGQRPHKISVAAAALAAGINEQWPSESCGNAILLCLGTVLLEVDRNGVLYPFNSIDEQLLALAVSKFAEQAELDSELGSEIEQMLDAGIQPSHQGYRNPTTVAEAGKFIDAEIAAGRMTTEQFEVICKMLSLGAMMTGNLQEAYEMAQGKPVDGDAFSAWLSNDEEGRRWYATWIVLRKGQPDTEYKPV